MTDSNSTENNCQNNNDNNNIPEWLTENIFTNILEENQTNFKKINSFNVKPAVATGENFMTLLLNVKINAEMKDETSQQFSYMLKIQPNAEKMQEMLNECRVFEKELQTYSSYIPEFETMYKNAGLNVDFGAKVLTTTDPKAPKDLIIMEDLSVKGFKNIKRQEGLDLEHTQKTLDKLAQFHAASACRFELKGNYTEIFKKCLYSEQDIAAQYREAVANLFIECLPLYNAEYLKEKLVTYTSVVPDQFQIESIVDNNEFNVLNHGDCWSNNIMFKYNDDGSIADTIFVDYQMSRYGSPAHDLSYLLISSTKLENKIKKFDYFISYYHEKLLMYLKLLKYSRKLPTLKELHIAMLKHGDWAYTAITTVMPILLLDSTEKANIDNVLDEGENGEDLKKLMFKNSRYIDHMKLLLPWIDNRGLFVYTE